jgi:hypothetical protein
MKAKIRLPRVSIDAESSPRTGRYDRGWKRHHFDFTSGIGGIVRSQRRRASPELASY